MGLGDKQIHAIRYTINNKVLLYSIGNYTHYHLITHNGKESAKTISIYVQLSHCAAYLKPCKSTTSIKFLKKEIHARKDRRLNIKTY